MTLAVIPEIKTVPASIEFNFDAVKSNVSAHLEKFRGVVLTDETFKEGKELIKEINSTRKLLEEARKSEAKKAGEPIKFFEGQMKVLVSLHDELLDDLRTQIAKFEEAKKIEIQGTLESLIADKWKEKNVRPEFQSSSVSHLILLGSLTPTGKLTGAATAEIERLASNDLLLQTQTDMRLSQLEAMCYKAGLAAPLTHGHVSHFLFDDEVSYQTRLNALMSNELEREKQAIEFRRAQEFKRHQESESLALQSSVDPTVEAEHTAVEEITDAPEPKKETQNTANIEILVKFSVSVSSDMEAEKVAGMLDEKLKAAGLKTHSIVSAKKV